MKQFFKYCLFFIIAAGLVFFSCKVKKDPPEVYNLRGKITKLSLDLIGIPYQYGGDDITGFDCSGFVHYVYDAFGISLPRTAKKQGKLKNRIKLKESRKGDIFVFKLKRGWHSGIFVGAKYFVHAPNISGVVRKENLNSYWLSRLKYVIQVLKN